ncbi:MAG: hypothetical protein SNJ72_03960 [Fimbriimonadales bacterium]
MHKLRLLLLGWLPACVAFTQSVCLAPRYTSTDWFTLLTRSTIGSALSLSVEGATNVHPLLADPPKTTQYTQHEGYFTGFTAYRGRVRWGDWHLTYGWELAEAYEGNNGAVRLYLEANQDQLDPSTGYPVSATLNRSAVSRFALDYRGQTAQNAWHVVYSVGIQGAFLRRVQQGTLVGTKSGDQFVGRLTLESTRDVPPNQRGGFHLGLDVMLVAHSDSGWSVGIAVENLWGFSSVRRVQRIEAQVSANRFEPDSEGFLRGAPLLEGTTRSKRLSRVAEPYLHMGVVAPVGRALRSTLIAEHIERWRWGVGLTELRNWWAIVWVEPSALQIGYRQPGWQLTLGLDHPNPQQAKVLTVELGISLVR